MDPRVTDTINLILDNPQDIESIIPDRNEYYFTFRSRTFSITHSPENGFSFYIYPRWKSGIPPLIDTVGFGQEDPDASFVRYESEGQADTTLLKKLYEFMTAKHLNIDDFFDKILKKG